ncbi:MAG: DUF58 domain-containing protein [Cytophagaceae bacterium]
MFLRKFRYFFDYIPFRINFLLFAVFGAIAFFWLRENYVSTESSFGRLISLTGLMIINLAAILITISFATTLLSWLHFFIVYRHQQIQVFLGKDIKETAGWVPVEVQVDGALRPFLGYIKASVIFNDFTSTSHVVLDSSRNSPGQFIRKGLKGITKIWLPDRKEYQVKESRLYFNDYFRMFSFACSQPFKKSMYTTPPPVKIDEMEVVPNSSEDLTTRIPTMRRVEGDFFNYKNFEPTDDPRRIVWKLYARNKELVIKVPEVFNPFASHLYLIPSFYKEWKGSTKLETELLNGYKDKLRFLTDSLLKQGAAIKVVSDQEVSSTFEVNEEEKILYRISTAAWQNQVSLLELVKPNTHPFICISSLTPAEMLESLPLLKSGSVIFYVRLSDTYRWAWLRKGLLSFGNIFVRLKDTSNLSLTLWWLSPLGMKIRRNEKKINTILENQSVAVVRL